MIASCGGAGMPGMPGGKGGKPDPDACGDASIKVKSFLEATVQLNDAVVELEGDVKVSCQAIAEELGVPAEGDTAKVCNAVAAAIKANLSASFKGSAQLKIDYKPAVCEVKADIAAEAAAKCEGKASADMKVECTGRCEGTCSGTCSGKCEGSGGAAAGGGGATAAGRGECAGQCDGTCEGSCSGGCSGSADVDASVECEAKAEVSANVSAECTPPELNITFDAKAVTDAPKVEMTINAIKKGLPKLIAVKAKLEGPVALAFKSWAKAAGGLKGSIKSAGLCVGGQLTMAAGLLGQIQGSMSVSVQASVSVSGSATGSAG
jgi:modification target Cys-rich repeat protein